MSENRYEERLLTVSLEILQKQRELDRLPTVILGRLLSRRRKIKILAIAAGLIGLGILFFWLYFRSFMFSSPPHIISLDGECGLSLKGRIPLGREIEIASPCSIRGEWGQNLKFLILGRTRVMFLSSINSILPWRDSSKIVLNRGELVCEWQTKHTPRRLQLQTPFLVMEVYGTKFRLVHTPEQGTELEVYEGKVKVSQTSSDPNILFPSYWVLSGYGIKLPTSQVRAKIIPSNVLKKKPFLSFYFDRLDVDARWRHGTFVIGPNQYPCIRGEPGYPYAKERSVIQLTTEDYTQSLFSYHPDQEITFSYWVPRGTTEIILQIWNDTQKQNYHYRLPIHRWETWVDCIVKIRDFQPILYPHQSFQLGDRLNNFLIVGEESHIGKPYFTAIEFVQ